MEETMTGIPGTRWLRMALPAGLLIVAILCPPASADDLSTYRLDILRDGELLLDIGFEGSVNEFRTGEDEYLYWYHWRGGDYYLSTPVRWQRDGFTTAGDLRFGVGDAMMLGVGLGLGPWSGYRDPRYVDTWSPASRGYLPSFNLSIRPAPTVELYGDARYRRLELDRPPWPLGYPSTADVDIDQYTARGGLAVLIGARGGRVSATRERPRENLDAYLLPLLAPGRVLLTVEGTYEERRQDLSPSDAGLESTDWCEDLWHEEWNAADDAWEGTRRTISGGLEAGLADGLAAGVRLRYPIEWDDGCCGSERYSPSAYLAARPGRQTEIGGTYAYTALEDGSEQNFDIGFTYLGSTGERIGSRRPPAMRGLARYRLPLLADGRYLLTLSAGHTRGIFDPATADGSVEAKAYRVGTDFSYGLTDEMMLTFSAAGSQKREWTEGVENQSALEGRLGVAGAYRPGRRVEFRGGIEYTRLSVDDEGSDTCFDRDGLGLTLGATLLFGAY
ncbi:hypothetical protein AMJ71_07785 [candidate division TA06 bacterium SM1_40]|uniref:Uncharacterized protein n=1 Tax=candidate division TA06 bacterium SM1_40 TaxID=1703773 RepID=A0A0S8JJU3_UNCT6|nr:MAG: hypothetical protein AMJ71_07785 [candidate division TA06 bacterium SM1_40]